MFQFKGTSSFRESASEPGGKAVSGKHSIYTLFPKDRNCDICMRTKITRAPCRKRTGTTVPRAANFGDLIKAYDKVLSEGCESRNNHRYAVVGQDLATQWMLSYPCKPKLLRRLKTAYKSSWSRGGNQKSFTLTTPIEFGKACEDLSWKHCTSTPHRSETSRIAERAARRIQEGTSAVLLQSGLDEKWWADSMECYCYLRNIQDILV